MSSKRALRAFLDEWMELVIQCRQSGLLMPHGVMNTDLSQLFL